MNFKLFVDFEVTLLVERLPRRQQRQIREAFHRIYDSPEGVADVDDQDGVGRGTKVMIVGQYAIFYWIDHADRHIRILRIASADRA